jgi:ATP-binding cassette subfamily A (ABC1) protein 3
VHNGEVFGFLGHNGAGKTSAIKCIIGELSCTAGSVHVGGFDMERQAGQARQQVGYCPQFDALLELLTVRDHLEFYAALKGLPASAVTQAQKDFGLAKSGHRRADVLSGGNKRKLSAAIALMGRPSLAVLDEPSCGLDPAARRALWDAVHSAVKGSFQQGAKPSAVLLTTHSMEEAEALSTRLGIIAEGQLLTVGTSQQIKQRHGSCHELCFTLAAETPEVLKATLHDLGKGQLQHDTPLDIRSVGPLLEADAWKKRGYARPRCVIRAQIEAVGHVEAAVLAEWWLQQARGEAVEIFLKALLSDAVELAENFGPYWRFRLPHSPSVGLPEIFRHLEERGKELGITEYTLTQATLEQIFNTIAQDADSERMAALSG